MSRSNRAVDTLGGYFSRLTPPLICMLAIYLLSSITGFTPDGELRRPGWIPEFVSNLLHIPMYLLLAWLWCRALAGWLYQPLMIAVLLSAGFGLFDEWHQISVPGRTFSVNDLLLNLIGIALGVWLFRNHSPIPRG